MKRFVIPITIGVLLTAVSGASRPHAQQSSAVRMADVNVPGPANAVSFPLPATPYAAFNAFVRVLEAANVRCGVEGPASDPAKPPIDFARELERSVPLAGRRLGDALNDIVKAAPQFRWSDAGGTIVVRASADGDGILDRHLARFSVSNATPREALAALVAALDPARTNGLGLQERSNGAPAPRKVTLSLRDVTVQTVLTTLAHEYGTLSWTVKYDAAPASVATASITFTTPDGFVRAMSPTWLRVQSLDPQGRWRLGIGSEMLKGMLLGYAERTQISVNIEEFPSTQSRTTFALLTAGMPPLELPDHAEQAVARIVALDSRYEWSQEGGRFLVRPKATAGGRSALLDKTMPELSAVNERADAVIARVMSPVGSIRLNGSSSAGLPPNAAADAMAMRINVHLPGPITIRDALNAIADATGWMWSVHLLPPSARTSVLSLEWRGRVARHDAGRGISVPPTGNVRLWTTAFSISTSPLASEAPTMALPVPNPQPAVTPPPPNPFLALPVTGESLRHALAMINGRDGVLIGLEFVASSTPGPTVISPRDRVELGDRTTANALEKIQELATDYTVSFDSGVYHVRPRDAQRDSTPWLTLPVARFQRRFEHMRDALAAVARLDWPRDAPAATIAPPPSDRIEPLMKTSIAISLTNVTVRDILDEIARKHGAMYWAVEQRVAVSGPLVRVTFAGRGWSIVTTVR